MTITLLRDKFPDLLPMQRSQGMHVSEVIRDLCIRLGHFEKDDPDAEVNMLRLQLGTALEHAIAARCEEEEPGRYVRVGELWLDGMYGTPDLVDTQGGGGAGAVVEIKLTWTSSRHAAAPEGEKFWRYWVQVAAYCWMLGLEVGRLQVCYVNGDYSYQKGPGGGPQFREWERVFTRRELAENWEMLRRRGLEIESQRGEQR